MEKDQPNQHLVNEAQSKYTSTFNYQLLKTIIVVTLFSIQSQTDQKLKCLGHGILVLLQKIHVIITQAHIIYNKSQIKFMIVPHQEQMKKEQLKKQINYYSIDQDQIRISQEYKGFRENQQQIQNEIKTLNQKIKLLKNMIFEDQFIHWLKTSQKIDMLINEKQQRNKILNQIQKQRYKHEITMIPINLDKQQFQNVFPPQIHFMQNKDDVDMSNIQIYFTLSHFIKKINGKPQRMKDQENYIEILRVNKQKLIQTNTISREDNQEKGLKKISKDKLFLQHYLQTFGGSCGLVFFFIKDYKLYLLAFHHILFQQNKKGLKKVQKKIALMVLQQNLKHIKIEKHPQPNKLINIQELNNNKKEKKLKKTQSQSDTINGNQLKETKEELQGIKNSIVQKFINLNNITPQKKEIQVLLLKQRPSLEQNREQLEQVIESIINKLKKQQKNNYN